MQMRSSSAYIGSSRRVLRSSMTCLRTVCIRLKLSKSIRKGKIGPISQENAGGPRRAGQTKIFLHIPGEYLILLHSSSTNTNVVRRTKERPVAGEGTHTRSPISLRRSA
jgi:hypothetical protein